MKRAPLAIELCDARLHTALAKVILEFYIYSFDFKCDLFDHFIIIRT